MALFLNPGDILGMATYCAKVVYLADTIGAFSSSPMAIMSISSLFTSNTPTQMETHQKTSHVVCNLDL